MRSVLTAIFMLTLFHSACSQGDVATIPASERTAWGEAQRTLKTLGGSMAGERRHADGTLGYFRLRISDAGKLSDYLAVEQSGEVLPLREAELRFAKAHWAQWGSVGLQTARRIGAERLTSQSRYVGFYSGGTQGKAQIREVLEVVANAEPTFFDEPPMVIFTAGDVELRKLSKIPFFTKIVDGRSLQASPSALNGIPSSATTSYSDLAYAARGVTGNGIKVGIVESFGDTDKYPGVGCQIWEAHEAFGALTGVKYMHSQPLTCSRNSDCDVVCGYDHLNPGACRNGVCVEPHSSLVASRVAANQVHSKYGGPWHAGRSELFIANNFEHDGFFTPKGYVITPERLNASYHWLMSQDVRIINESYELAQPGFNFRSVLSDWYTRYRGMTFVQASGNFEEGEDKEVRCTGFNSLCVGAFDDNQDSDRDPKNFQFSFDFSRWKNIYSGTPDALEVEKPDLVAEGSTVSNVLDFQANLEPGNPGLSTTTWGLRHGTSFASPVVAGAIALMREDCAASRPEILSPLMTRAILRTAPVAPNLLEVHPFLPSTCPGTSLYPNYPTAVGTHGCDFRAGVGLLDTRDLVWWCEKDCRKEEGGPCVGDGEGMASPDDPDWEPIPEWMASFPGERSLEQAREDGVLVNALRAPHAQMKRLQGLGARRKGTRIRSSFSYYSCPMGGTKFDGTLKPDDLTTAVNFDYAICGLKVGAKEMHCIDVSESLHDANEGVDVRLVEDYDSIGLYLIGPEEWEPCSDGIVNHSTAEPYAYAWAIWQAG